MKWRHVGRGEFTTSLDGLVARVRYGAPHGLYHWIIHPERRSYSLDKGAEDHFEAAMISAERRLRSLAKEERMLFNAGWEWIKSPHFYDLWKGWGHGFVGEISKNGGEDWHWRIYTRKGRKMAEGSEGTLREAKQAVERWSQPRTLFNPEISTLPLGQIWIDYVNPTARREEGYRWGVYLSDAFLHALPAMRVSPRKPVAAGFARTRTKAWNQAITAYSSLTKKLPRMLFNNIP